MRKRTVYYVWFCTADENQNGSHHRSEPFYEVGEAKTEATLKMKINDFVSIDKVREVYDRWEWQQEEGLEVESIEM